MVVLAESDRLYSWTTSPIRKKDTLNLRNPYENGQSAPAPAATNATSVQSSSPDSPTNAATQTSQDSKEPNSPSYHGRIVGGILGSFGIILLGLVAFLWYRQGKSSNASINLTPPLNRSRSPGAFPARWAPSWRWKSSSVTSSRASFNPSKFIDPVSYGHPIASAPSPPVVTVLPVRPPPRPDAASTLEPNRPISVPAPVLDARNEQSEPRSIIEWRRRTQAEAEAIPPNLDENMSSFYEFSSNPGPTVSPPSPPHPRRSALRHFTVVNN
ncbi:hypothetical protein H0H81_004284 [Sphagnurus paluster]|uniref:Uncharacterized protein n=1 Tax=Sphagnurus paluster TaxID=117069 RepID=A0A9P7KN01_9AGAR|nr:hypothetical protein H0H81_004284 [Sphagnurus paluster]